MMNEDSLNEYRLFLVRKPPIVEIEQDIEWICRSFGFLESRDKNRTAYSIFRAIVEAARKGEGVSTDQLAQELNLSRGTMVHHINKMIKSGLVMFHEGQYKLRGRSLKSTIIEIQKDIDRFFSDVQYVVETIDQKMDLPSR
jgi:predicted transcriptional regulator